jgi:hypothetical protein
MLIAVPSPLVAVRAEGWACREEEQLRGYPESGETTLRLFG